MKTNNEPNHILILKIIVILIVLNIIGFIIYNNFLISQEFNYFYDLGGEEDAKKPYLTPEDRVSDIIIEGDVDYRDLKSGLVYFDIPISRGSKEIRIEARFKDSFPNNSRIELGGRDNKFWHYLWYPFYSQKEENRNNWIISNIFFKIEEENLFLKNGELNIAFRVFHLAPQNIETNTQYIPLDWIKITVYKPGLIEKLQEGTPFWQALKEVTS